MHVKHERSCIHPGPVFLEMPNLVLIIILNDIEVNDHRLVIASRDYYILLVIKRVIADKPYFKLRIVMSISSPLEGAALLYMR